MVRTVISLDEADKEWLDREAARLGVPMTELVRRAVGLLRRNAEIGAEPFERLLELTAGTWQHGDGLDYQRCLRDEW